MILSVLQTDFFENIVEAEKMGLIGNEKVELTKYDNNHTQDFKKVLSITTSPADKKKIINSLFGTYALVLDKIELKDGTLHLHFFDLKGRVEQEIELLKTIS